MVRAATTEGCVFEPEAIEAMHRAYVEACLALRVFAGDRRGCDAVATHVIELAKTGLIDSAALRDRVLMEARAAA